MDTKTVMAGGMETVMATGIIMVGVAIITTTIIVTMVDIMVKEI